jgi:hypothetical protein
MHHSPSTPRFVPPNESILLHGHRLSGICGVLAVEHISGARLICSSRDLCKRLWDEREALRRGQHYNANLQRLLQTDGNLAFRIVLLGTLPSARYMGDLKQYHIDRARSADGALNFRSVRYTSVGAPLETWT